MRTGTRTLSAGMIAAAAFATTAVMAHAAASTITATPTPFSSFEQVDFTQPGLGACSVPPPPVFQGCTAPQADCNFYGIDAARFRSSRANASEGQFSASVTYSDGSSGVAFVRTLSDTFTVVAEHPTFPEPTALTATVTITDQVDGSSATVTTPISIAERVFRGNGCDDRTATAGRPFTGLPVAIVLDSEQGTPEASATISWGDGTTSAGTWQPTDRYPYADLIDGAHTYGSAGRYQVTVTVVEPDDPASQATVSTVVAVSSAIPIPATGAVGGPAPGGALVALGLALTSLGTDGLLRRRAPKQHRHRSRPHADENGVKEGE